MNSTVAKLEASPRIPDEVADAAQEVVDQGPTVENERQLTQP